MTKEELFDFENEAQKTWYQVSDGSEILVLSHKPPNPKYQLFFLPGLGTQIYSWRFVLDALKEDHEIFYLETREKPSSKVKTDDFSPQRMFKDVTEVIQQLPLQNDYYAIGSSMGSTILLALLGLHEIHPKFTVLVGPAPEIKVSRFFRLVLPLFSKRIYRFTSPLIQWFVITFKTNKKEEPEQAKKYAKALREADPDKLRKTLYAWQGYTIWDLLPKIQDKCYLIGATKDKLHDINLTLKIAKNIPNSTFKDLESNKKSHSYPLVEFIRNEVFPHYYK